MKCWRYKSPGRQVLSLIILAILVALPAAVLAAKFESVKIGELGPDGKLIAKTVFVPETKAFIIIAELQDVKAGTKVTADMVYFTPEGPIKPLSTSEVAKQAGGVTTTFQFSKPSKGWPQGNYKIVITLSTGETQEVAFKVE
jgi:hypothetical protein